MPASTVADARDSHTSRRFAAFLEIGALRTGKENTKPALYRIKQAGGTSDCLIAENGATF